MAIIPGKLAWLLWRLRAMEKGEWKSRLVEVYHKRTETRFLGKISKLRPDLKAGIRRYPVLPTKQAAPADLKVAVGTEADRILSGEWDCLHGQILRVPDPPDWVADPLNSVRFPEVTRAHRIDHRNLPDGMDVRLVWEINRWTQIVRLSQAAWLDDDGKMAQKAISWLENWLDVNPLGVGLNWTSPMEPAIRLINFSWIHALLSDAGFSAEADALANRILPSHTAWVWRYRSAGSSANNHLIGELAGLAIAVSRWPDLTDLSATPEKLADLLGREILTQFAGDGGNREQALHYHLFAWEMAYQGIEALKTAGAVFPNAVELRMRKAAAFFAKLAEDGWDFGDSDDAHVTPFYNKEKTSVCEWKAFLGANPTPEELSGFDFWLGARELDSTLAGNADSWTVFPESGIACWEAHDLKLRFDASPLGFLKMAAHGHLDALHLSIWKSGVPVVVDPGTGGYFASAHERSYLTSAAAHNGPRFPDQSLYPSRRGSFLWERHHPIPEILADSHSPHPDSNTVMARWAPCRSSPEATRSISPGNDRVVVSDHCADHEFEVFWQLATGWELESASPCSWNFISGGICLSIEVTGARESEVTPDTGLTDVSLRGLVSSAFGKYHRAPFLCLRSCPGETLSTTFAFTRKS